MDSDEIAVALPVDAALSSPSDDPLQNPGPVPPPTQQTQRPLAREYVAPSGNDDELENDLSDFGFRANKVNELMSKREFRFDTTMQRPQGQTYEDRENERRGLSGRSIMGSRALLKGMPMQATRGVRNTQRGLKRVKVRGEKAEGLVIEGNGNWVLFNPQTHEFPRRYSADIPAVFQRYMRYETGNTRIVEFNLESSSVRLKTTPEALVGKAVEYTKIGPKLVDDEIARPPKSNTVRGRLGRPRKRGGRGGGLAGIGNERLTDIDVNNGRAGTLEVVQKPVVKAEPKTDNDSGSESSLTDLEAMKEVEDSQEGDASFS